MNRQNLVIDGQNVSIIDDFYSKDTCTKWLRFYAQTSFKITACEDGTSNNTMGSPYFFTKGLSKQELEEVFEMSTHVLDEVKQWNEATGTNFAYTDCTRAHINLTQSCDHFSGHVDHPTNDILIFLWFGNPYFEDDGGGIYLGNNGDIVEHKFNRCVVFPGSLWHKIQSLTNDASIRLSVYIGFEKTPTSEKELKFDDRVISNVLSKDNAKTDEIIKMAHRDFGIGN